MKMMMRKTSLWKQFPPIQMVNVLAPVLAITQHYGAGDREVLAMRVQQHNEDWSFEGFSNSIL